jgi:hypothetical protein
MLLEQFRKYTEAGDFDALADLYAEDALLDANVPAWRFQRRGRAEIRDQYSQWYPTGGANLVEWRVQPAPWGAVVELAEKFRAGTPKELYARTIEVVVIEGDLITQHTVYCTGPWDSDTVARHQAVAPMARP